MAGKSGALFRTEGGEVSAKKREVKNCHNCGKPQDKDRSWIEKGGGIWTEHSCGNCPSEKWASFTKRFKDQELADGLRKLCMELFK